VGAPGGGCARLCVGLLFLLRSCGGRVSWATAFVVGLYLLETKTVAFAANGMETPFFTMFAAGAL